ncbi:MAG: NAD/NADP octopine/nopaline dehydrogenase family protein [Anaerolineales bacterium]|nr:NAD/NADP octopine/nopaline dehydrogenase family protein [Anaerolineales bacterium]
MKTHITICGGGNAAHTLTGLLSSNDELSVRVYLPFGDEAEKWREGILQNGGITVDTPQKTLLGKPNAICQDPRDAVTEAQIILLALPAFAHEPILKQIAPYIYQGAWVGALPARGGLDLCFRDIFKERLSEIVIFGFQTLPWACRIQHYGKQATILGAKEQVDLTAWPANKAPVISTRLQELFGISINPVSSFLSLMLADTGQIIHPGIMYGLFHEWDGVPYEQQKLFYQAVDEEIAAVLQNMSEEIQMLRARLETVYPAIDLTSARPIDEWLKRSYRANIVDGSTLHASFATNRSYAGLMAPMIKTEDGFIPDFQARYLSEDVPYNLLVTRGVAELAGITTPMIDQVLLWAQERLNKEYLVEGKVCGKDLPATRAPQRYGLTDIYQLVQEMDYL